MLNKNDITVISKIVRQEIQSEIKPVKKDINTLKTDMAKIRKDLSMVLGFLDSEYVKLRQRVDRIEEHLGLSAS